MRRGSSRLPEMLHRKDEASGQSLRSRAALVLIITSLAVACAQGVAVHIDGPKELGGADVLVDGRVVAQLRTIDGDPRTTRGLAEAIQGAGTIIHVSPGSHELRIESSRMQPILRTLRYERPGEDYVSIEAHELIKGEVMAWQWASSEGKRYLLPEDSCYESYRRFLPPDIVQYFSSAPEAERSGFRRKAVVLAPLKKYAAICSHLYEYALTSVCEKVFLDDPGRAGFVPIERFTTLANVRVVGIERSRTYLTPCDKDYACLIDPNEARSSECEQVAKSTGPLRVFSSEREAREAGYVSEAEAFFSEMTEELL